MAPSFAATRPVFVPNLSASKDTYDEGNKVVSSKQTLQLLSRTSTCCRNKLVREMTFVDGKAFEVKVESHSPTIMYFETSTGMRITNVISYGTDNELLLTYAFANGLPYVPAEQPKPSAKALNVMLAKDLDRTLTMFREAVKEGKL
ncbi:hypothetical protein C8R46DRAFT_1234714 [Mycena filopes]|nr:hypothetical protein C8R46DRAFT_1234714 [Mycena filopes]